MPELGRYAVHVLGSYGATLALLGGLVLLSWRQSLRVRRRLQAVEHGGGRTVGRTGGRIGGQVDGPAAGQTVAQAGRRVGGRAGDV